MVGHADDHGMTAAHRFVGMRQQGHDALRRARTQAGLAQGQTPDVFGVEAVHVLVRANALDQVGGVDVRRQRQLHEDAVDLRIGIEAIDQRIEFCAIDAGRKVEVLGHETDTLAGAALVAHIDRRGWIGADQHHGQSRATLTALDARAHALADAIEHLVRNPLAIQYARRHRTSRKGAHYPRRHHRSRRRNAGARPAKRAGEIDSPALHVCWRARRDSNPRPPGSKPGALSS